MPKKNVSTSAKPGAVIIFPTPGPVPKVASGDICDGCGAEVWVLVKPQGSRVFCIPCLQARKVI